MTDRIPIQRAAQLDHLDDAETVEGYRDGRAGDEEPGDNRSFSYWHGWRNGRADRNGKPDAAQRALAHDYLKQARK